MEDLTDPSFSLGFDFDFSEDERAEAEDPASECKEVRRPSSTIERPEWKSPLPTVQEEFESPSFNLFTDELQLDLDLDQDPEPEEAPALKRLRRGAVRASVSCDARLQTPIGSSLPKKDNRVNGGISGSDIFFSLEDEIEDFSSEEDPFLQDGCIRKTSYDASSSSKISLRNQGVLTSQSTNKIKIKPHKILPNSISSTSSNLEKGERTKLLPKLKLSPMRKIYLLSSDSDSGPDFNYNKNKQKILKEPVPSVKKLATPALDKFCDEYFRSEKDRNSPHKREGSTSMCSSRVFDPVEFTKDFDDILPKEELPSEFLKNKPPCYTYFNHTDVRIRALVRERLPHFTPIGIGNGRIGDGNIDYLGQFGKRDEVKGKRVKNGGKKNSAPADVGKRRVQAEGQNSGHWFTGQDGKKVYMAKNGQELTGQFAYRQYKKENGGGFRKSKKQGSTRKKGKK